MGIPRLYASFKPFAETRYIGGSRAVIDGPALAYHILHICRSNGVDQPSYDLLGQIAISWLNKLLEHNVAVDSIYFDGYLPEWKLSVRVGRMMSITSRLHNLHRSNPHGLPRPAPTRQEEAAAFRFFDAGEDKSKSSFDPCFLVPAIIDALREHETYRAKVHLIPGEADEFCAAAVRSQGGIVLTSDSDLLIQDLGCGQVAFFRDIQHDHMCRLIYLNFTPQKIFTAAGLAYPEKAIQLAYEWKRSPKLSFAQILKRCAEPVPHDSDYESFQRRYVLCAKIALSRQIGLDLATLQHLDPRVSELILSVSFREQPSAKYSPTKFFLPQLMECPAMRSAWDQSTPLRQAAYTIVNHCVSQRHHAEYVHEYRRVEDASYAGRRVRLISPDLAQRHLNEVLLHAVLLKKSSDPKSSAFWVALAMTIDLLHSHREEKASLLHTLRNHLESDPKVDGWSNVPWVMIHVVAGVHGILYSFRILQQAILSASGSRLHDIFSDMESWTELFSSLIPLRCFPHDMEVIRVAQNDLGVELTKMLGKPHHEPRSPPHGGLRPSGSVNGTRENHDLPRAKEKHTEISNNIFTHLRAE